MIAKGSFEDFLYIFIGLIWIGFSIYKAQQKKKAAAGGQINTKKEKSFLDNLMSEFITEEEANPYELPIEEPSPAETFKPRETRASKIFSYDDIYEESNLSADFDVFEKKPEYKPQYFTEKITNKQQQKRKPKIDLRKAVIYSEILTRKYS